MLLSVLASSLSWRWRHLGSLSCIFFYCTVLYCIVFLFSLFFLKKMFFVACVSLELVEQLVPSWKTFMYCIRFIFISFCCLCQSRACPVVCRSWQPGRSSQKSAPQAVRALNHPKGDFPEFLPGPWSGTSPGQSHSPRPPMSQRQ